MSKLIFNNTLSKREARLQLSIIVSQLKFIALEQMKTPEGRAAGRGEGGREIR